MARSVVKQGGERRPASPVTKVQICAAAKDPVNRGAAGFRCCTVLSYSPRVSAWERGERGENTALRHAPAALLRVNGLIKEPSARVARTAGVSRAPRGAGVKTPHANEKEFL